MKQSNGYCTFTSLGRYGRFANQIFQIAGTIGIARKNGLEPVFPKWINHDHGERFGSREDINVYKHMVNDLPGSSDIGNNQYINWQTVSVEWGYHDVTLLPGTWDLAGHFQSAKYFQHCIDEVRHFMKMKQEVPDIQDIVAVHWRCGDYDNKYHPVQEMTYYVNAIKQFPEDQKFLLFSDNRDFRMILDKALIGAGLVRRTGQVNDSYLNEFALMKKCRHFIIGNSSYSAAAAILSDAPDKKVIAPSNWFGAAYAGINAKDVYCSDWIII